MLFYPLAFMLPRFHERYHRHCVMSCALQEDPVSHRHFSIFVDYYRAQRADVGSVNVHDRDCSGCFNEMLRCDFKATNTSIVVDRLALEFTNDAEV